MFIRDPVASNRYSRRKVNTIDDFEVLPTLDDALDEYEQSLIERHRQYADEVHDAET